MAKRRRNRKNDKPSLDAKENNDGSWIVSLNCQGRVIGELHVTCQDAVYSYRWAKDSHKHTVQFRPEEASWVDFGGVVRDIPITYL